MRASVCLLLIIGSASGFAKCAIFTREVAVSANGRYRVILEREKKYMIQQKTASGWVMRRSGKIRLLGHHIRPWISDTGDRIVVTDEYAGYGVYNESGQPIHLAAPGGFLTKPEMKQRFDAWTCHPEGRWLRSSAISGRTLSLTLPTKRVLKVSLDPSSEATVLQRAREIVGRQDTWADRATYKATRKGHQWTVLVRRIEGYDQEGRPQFVPGGERLLVIGSDFGLKQYIRGH